MEDSITINRAFEDLLEDFNHPNPNINNDAFANMHIYFPNESKLFLINNLKSNNVEIRRKSVKALAYFGTSIISEIVELYLKSSILILRVSCLKVLVKLSVKNNLDAYFNDLLPIFELAVKDESVEITLTVVSLLRQIGSSSLPILLKLSMDENILRAKASITAIGEISDPIAFKKLHEIANNKMLDEILRNGAIEALNKNGA